MYLFTAIVVLASGPPFSRSSTEVCFGAAAGGSGLTARRRAIAASGEKTGQSQQDDRSCKA